MSGTGVGVAVVTHPAALLAIRPGPGTPAGETVPPPVTIFTTQTTRSRLLTTYTAHALLTLTNLLYDITLLHKAFTRTQPGSDCWPAREMWESNPADTRDMPTNSPPRAPLPPKIWKDKHSATQPIYWYSSGVCLEHNIVGCIFCAIDVQKSVSSKLHLSIDT